MVTWSQTPSLQPHYAIMLHVTHDYSQVCIVHAAPHSTRYLLLHSKPPDASGIS